MEVGLVKKIDIDHEMQQSYLDYAMSVIVSRALPDARDGLKPVQRRILYAMYDMGIRADSQYKKSARIVGEVLGKYHPHGDQAVYEAMARMAQYFSMRNMMVDGQGNFGSVDGDPPAAMRYTEARLTSFSIDMLNQIERQTVNFTRNFDDTLDEPEVLPAALPNLLVNGASGIAVGMATNIPPHNLNEVIDGLIFLLQNWEKLDDISVEELMKFIQGPDLPTGGILIQDGAQNDLLSAYGTGRGRAIIRGRVHFEDMGRGKSRIIINELPYQTNKSALIERIAELAREGVIEGISDLRDESDRQGMRIVIELSKAAEGENILKELYRRTPLESTLSISLLALVKGEPRLLTLKQALKVYIEHRLEVVKRRSEYDLNKARQRLHILDGLRIAINNLDEVISTIRNSPDVETAKARLIKRFKLSEIQAQAILDMQLRRLAALERKKIEQEYKDILQQVKELELILKSPKKMRGIVQDELSVMRQTYGDRRRTLIVSLKEGEVKNDRLTATDMSPAQTVWIGATLDGRIGRTHGDELPRISGRTGVTHLLKTNTHHTLYLACKNGKSAAIAVHAIPEMETFDLAVPLGKVSPLVENDELAALFSLPPSSERKEPAYVITVSRSGMIKKSDISELPGPSSQAFLLAKTGTEDQICSVLLTKGFDELILASAHGMIIRFSEQDLRPMGLSAVGVNGMKLAENDLVSDAQVSSGDEILLAASSGNGCRFGIDQVPLQGRYGQGVIAIKLNPGTHLVGMLIGKASQSGIAHFKTAAARLIRLDQLEIGKRGLKGQEIVPVKTGDTLVMLTTIMDGLAPWASKSTASSPGGTAKRGKKTTTPGSKSAVAKPKTAPAGSEKEPKPAAKTTTTAKTGKTTSAQTAGTKKTSLKTTPKPAIKPATEKAKEDKKVPAAQKPRKKTKPPDDEQLKLIP